MGGRNVEEDAMAGMGGRVGSLGGSCGGRAGSSGDGSGDRQQQRSLRNRQAEVLVMESNCGTCVCLFI